MHHDLESAMSANNGWRFRNLLRSNVLHYSDLFGNGVVRAWNGAETPIAHGNSGVSVDFDSVFCEIRERSLIPVVRNGIVYGNSCVYNLYYVKESFMVSHDSLAHALKTFEQRKILTLPEVASLLQCLSRSAQGRLKQWQGFCSYNRNGRFYTLPHIARFDEDGLWKYKGVMFSKHGNLR